MKPGTKSSPSNLNPLGSLFSQSRRTASNKWLMLSLVGGSLTLPNAMADVRLPGLFSDNMVLQQGKQVSVWGWADEGENISVNIQGRSSKAVTKNGKWILQLDALTAGGPFSMTVSGKNNITLTNVLVGEVWVCSGQSNMEWPLTRTHEPQGAIDNSTNPKIRLFTVPKLKSNHPVDDVQSKWAECHPHTVSNFSAVAYYFGRDLQKALGIPIGLIHTSWGGSPAEVWMSSDVLENNPEYKKSIVEGYEESIKRYEAATVQYEAEMAELKKAGKTSDKKPPQKPFWKPSELYNGMIAPLLPYGIQGAIWYQGESNAGRAYQYRTLFPDMIRNWRRDWRQGDFSFLAVQLAPFKAIKDQPSESDWAELREAQLFATKTLPNVGLAVITDVGDEKDIHPQKKEPVGARLALAARGIAYRESGVFSGPVYKGIEIKNGQAIISFENAGSGLEARDGKLKGFAIAGSDRKFVWADAKIDGHKVVVSSPEVKEPVAVRFGWADYPVVNLWNKEGLPASPFRTDDFPMITGPKK